MDLVDLQVQLVEVDLADLLEEQMLVLVVLEVHVDKVVLVVLAETVVLAVLVAKVDMTYTEYTDILKLKRII